MPMLTSDFIDLNVAAGPLGPDPKTSSGDCWTMAEEATLEKYVVDCDYTSCICMDGRCSEQEFAQIDSYKSSKSPLQLPGGWVISSVAVSYMDKVSDEMLLDKTIEQETINAKKLGLKVFMHGDNLGGKSACLANKALRDILLTTERNKDLIADRVLESIYHLGLSYYVDETMIMQFIANGKKAALNDQLWDADPEQVVDIAETCGSGYMVLVGSHEEGAARIDETTKSFDKLACIKDGLEGKNRVRQVLSVSLGAAAQVIRDYCLKTNISDQEMAEWITKLTIFVYGSMYTACNQKMKVAIVR